MHNHKKITCAREFEYCGECDEVQCKNMRKIEFRVWFEGKMFHEDLDDIVGSVGSGGAGDWTIEESYGENMAKFVKGGYLGEEQEGKPLYMQYTGIKDRDGVKIFEGDKIIFLRAKHDLSLQEEAKGIVYYDDARARFMITGSEDYSFAREGFGDTDRIKVIGHIYEK